jgi:hypothetical protein
MQKPSYRSLSLFLFIMLSYAGYIWLRVQHILRIKEPREFYDTTEFMEFASRPLTSSSFWITNKPPVTSLFFRMLDLDLSKIVTAQLWISILAWGIFALVLAAVIRNFWLKPVAFVLILAFSLVQNVILWDSLILSDSLSISLLVLFLAAGLWLLFKWDGYRFVLFIVSSVLLAFVRDTYAYFLLMAGGGILVLIFFTRQRKRVLAVFGLFTALFLAVNAMSVMGAHWYTAFLMTMGLRILPNPDYVAYFEARGMPVSDELMERAGKPIQADGIAMMYADDLEEFRQWAKAHGRSEYVRFLWFFKADTLQNPLRDADIIFNPDVYYYAATGYRPILQDARLNELFYPTRFGLLASFLANFFAAALLYPAFHYRKLLWIVPLMLILFSYPQAVLVWNADANDMARHSIYHVIMIRLGFWMLVLFVLDFLFVEIKPMIMNRKFINA